MVAQSDEKRASAICGRVGDFDVLAPWSCRSCCAPRPSWSPPFPARLLGALATLRPAGRLASPTLSAAPWAGFTSFSWPSWRRPWSPYLRLRPSELDWLFRGRRGLAPLRFWLSEATATTALSAALLDHTRPGGNGIFSGRWRPGGRPRAGTGRGGRDPDRRRGRLALPMLRSDAGDVLHVIARFFRQVAALGEPILHALRAGIVGRGGEAEIAELPDQLAQQRAPRRAPPRVD